MSCLRPLMMFDTGRLTANGKHLYTFKAPYLPVNPIPVPCGKCPACLETRRKEWCKRLQLESLQYPVSSFVTLTYRNDDLPSDGLADKKHIQDFLKRFRNSGRDHGFTMPPFKYFIVSEYGKKFKRPHYHGIFFGIDFFADCWKPYFISLDQYPRFSSKVLEKSWSHGFVMVDRLSMASIRYVSKYITKQHTDGVWSLKSIGLARSLFVTNNGLSDFGLNVSKIGRVSLTDGKGNYYYVRTPKFLDRYLERYEPILFDSIRSSRRHFCINSPLADLGLQSEVLKLKQAREQTNRILDNET